MALNGPGGGGRSTPGEEKQSTEPPGIVRTTTSATPRKLNTDIPQILPHERVFPIQIGSEMFRLSGASISSDVPRLVSQLYEESIFITIGNRDFQIPRELFSDPGNSPNYFSLGFAVFFSHPTEVFPGLSREGLLRPPSIMPPSVPNRSADTFTELLHLLRGYPLQIRSEEHRAELLRDCRYFHLKGLEQKLIRHHITQNLSRSRSEITLRLEDVRQSGISIVLEASTAASDLLGAGGLIGFVHYARPFVDTQAHELILEIGDETCKVHLHRDRVEFFGEGKKRVSRLFEVIATKLNLPNIQPLGLLMKTGGASSQPASPGNTPISDDQVRVVLDGDAHVVVDGVEWEGPAESPSLEEEGRGRKRKRGDVSGRMPLEEESWIVKTGQWRLRVQSGKGGKGFECVLVAVKIDAVSGELGKNVRRAFLA